MGLVLMTLLCLSFKFDFNMGAEPGPEHLAFLKKHFGHSQFRSMQWKIINSILNEEKDQCVVMATGHGKSLCYQYPAVYLNAITIVISPLISLMQDQVLALAMMNISACFLGSAQTDKKATIDGFINNKYRVVYLTPEFCMSDSFQQILERVKSQHRIVSVAIDEAHCVSQWGLDFRPSYRKLGSLKEILPDVPFLTVTASATRTVCKDICSSLNLKNPEIIFTEFDRPNLFLAVWMKGRDPFSDMRRFMVRDGLRMKFPGPTIIYCPTRKASEVVATSLTDNGVECHFYHAQLKMSIREETHENFTKDIINVIAATSAFGMGIDKPDVRLIIHYGAPKEIESYYQEIGRAGRDGLPAACHIFYARTDFVVNSYFNMHLEGKFKEHRESMSRLMEKYLETQSCRRDIILSYFDERYKPKQTAQTNCCDNCIKSINGNATKSTDADLDLSDDAVLLLKTVKHLRGYCGLVTAVKFLRGSRAKTVKASPHPDIFGKGQKKSELWWKAIGRLLIREELLKQKGFHAFGGRPQFNKFSSCLSITDTGESYISDPEIRNKMKFMPTNEILTMAKSMEKSTERQSVSPKKGKAPLLDFTFSRRNLPKIITGVNHRPESEIASQSEASCSKDKDEDGDGMNDEETELQYDVYYGLMKKRTELARQHECMPYMIASNQLLLDLAKDRPHNMEELMKVEGLVEVKAEKFGKSILKTIREAEEHFKNRPKNEENASDDNDVNDETLIEDNTVEEPHKKVAREQMATNDVWGDEDDSFLNDLAFVEDICDRTIQETEDLNCINNKNSCNASTSLKVLAHSNSNDKLDKFLSSSKVLDGCGNSCTTSSNEKMPQLSPIMGENNESLSSSKSKIPPLSPLIGKVKENSRSNKSKTSSIPTKKRAITFIDSDEEEEDIDVSSTLSQNNLPAWIMKRNSTNTVTVKKRLKQSSLFK